MIFVSLVKDSRQMKNGGMYILPLKGERLMDMDFIEVLFRKATELLPPRCKLSR